MVSERYERQMLMPEIGKAGQEHLLASSALVVGCGGLGSTLLYCLCGMGVGRIGFCDGDVVSLSNLNRQFLHTPADIGKNKAQSAYEKLSAFAPGSPLDERTLMGPLANRQQYDKVLRLIQTARDEGDTIVCGGEALPGEGYFLQPTAVKVRSEESTLMREETFGPVCSFIGYRSEEEALARMNASPYGLAASVWSDNIRQALRYSEAIEAGIVWVNMHTFLDPAVPFGGMKGSGIGREFGSAFIDDYTELKSVMVRY